MSHSASVLIGSKENFEIFQECYAILYRYFLSISESTIKICIRRSFDEVCFTFKRCSFLFERERERVVIPTRLSPAL